MWTHYNRAGHVPKRKKVDRETVTLPAIPRGPTSVHQDNKNQTSQRRLQHVVISNSLPHHHPAMRTVNSDKDKRTFQILPEVSERRRGTEDEESVLKKSVVVVGVGDEEQDHWRREGSEGDAGDHHDATPPGSPTSLSAGSQQDHRREEEGVAPPTGSVRPPSIEAATSPRRKEEVPPPCVQKRRFMVYICGGYKDTAAERRALMEEVYPSLFLHCKQRGYDFTMLDLRQGLGNPVADDHHTAELHMETLARCQETPGPNFILFLGQKHEVQTLPSTMSTETFQAVARVLGRDGRPSPKTPGQEASTSNLQSSMAATATSAITFTRESVYGNYLSFGEDEGEEEGDEEAVSSGVSNHSSSQSSISSQEEEAEPSSAGGRSLAEEGEELTLLQAWYRLDENPLPPVYRLLPVSSHYPDILSDDSQRRRAARKQWSATRGRLWRALQRSAQEAVGEEGAELLLRTVLDWEVEQGLRPLGGAGGPVGPLGAPAEAHCHCYKRMIPDLLSNLRSPRASSYVDLLPGSTRIDPALCSAHQRCIERVHNKLRHTNIYERNVGWGRRGLNPRRNHSHRFYTQRICSHVQRTLTSALNSVMQVSVSRGPFDVERREAERLRVQEEIQRHIHHGLTLEKQCVLRQSFLAEVRKALLGSRESGPTMEDSEGGSRPPTLLLGPPGWGKSTLLARVAQLAPGWLSGCVQVVRVFVGLTAESRNVRRVLQSVCVQLAETYLPHAQLSQDVPQLSNDFQSLLQRVEAARPLVLVLDGLDQLSQDPPADLSWLAAPPPPHVHMLLSATTGSPCATTLQSVSHPTMLCLPPLSEDEVTAALAARLRASQRRLQPHQWEALQRACASCPSPLYMEAALWESQGWTSYCPGPQQLVDLPSSLEGLYLGLLARLERCHGQHLVRRASTLISLSHGGVTEEELLALLSKDEKLLQEVSSSSSSPPSRVPYVLWASLHRSLGPHLCEVQSNGTWVLRWVHGALASVCVQRYLKNREARMAVHADYADYYRDTSRHGGRIFQPLAWTLEEEEDEEKKAGGVERSGTGVSRVFNLRKLHGLPFHLVQSGQILPLFYECVFNYEFLLHKVWALSVLDVEEDLKTAVLPDREVLDVTMLSEALQMSRSVLQKDPCQLAGQIMGRLGKIVAEDRPVAPGDPLKFSYLHTLLSQCPLSSLPVLVPSSTCLLPPGGLAHTLLAGHWSCVTALGGGRRGSRVVSGEEDGTLRLWDLERRGVVRTLGGAEGVVADALTLALGDSLLVLCMGHRLQVRELGSGRVIYSESDSLDVPIVTTACEGQLLVVFYDGSHRSKVLDMSSCCSVLSSVQVSLEGASVHRDRSVLLSHNNCIKDYVLFAYRSGGQAAVFSSRSGTVLCVLNTQHASGSIQGVEMTAEYLMIFCGYPYKSDSEMLHIELFDSSSFQYQRSILGCSQDPVSQVCVNREGTHAVAFCPSPRTALTQVVTWNLETEDHKHIAHFPGILTQGVCADLRYCVGMCASERSLRLWDLSSRISDQSLTYNVHKTKSDGTAEVIPMGTTMPRYAICRSLRSGTVRVWNLARRRFSGRAVRVEHGLYGATDVVLAHNLHLYILTDQGSAPNTTHMEDTPPSVFQTLLVYDLVKKSYVRRQMGMSIVPCPHHEYRLLEDGHVLMGLSATRDHLILWDLDSGCVRERIRAPHRQSLLSSARATTPPTQKTPMSWELRTERASAKRRREERKAEGEREEQRRLDREKHNAIDQYLLSGDQQVLVCSYFSHHLNVFSVAGGSQDHLHTLEDRASPLALRTAALSHPGTHLLLAAYSHAQRTPYLSLWDLGTGTVKKRLQNEPGVCCVSISDDASRAAFAVTGINKVKVWDPFRGTHRSIHGYGDLRIDVSSKLYLTEGGAKAVLLSGHISLWDLDRGVVLSVLSLDAHIDRLTVLGGGASGGGGGCHLLVGLSHSPVLVAVTLTGSSSHRAAVATATTAVPEEKEKEKKEEKKEKKKEDLFGESSSSEDEEES